MIKNTIIICLFIILASSMANAALYKNTCWDLTSGRSCINGSTGNNTLQNTFINASYILNAPWTTSGASESDPVCFAHLPVSYYNKTMIDGFSSSINASIPVNISLYLPLVDQRYNDSASIPTNLSSYLPLLDQRYNETALVPVSATYYPSSFVIIYGTPAGGNNTQNISSYDGQTMNITEASGPNPLTLEVNYTGVTSLNSIIMREQYDGGTGHEIEVSLYDNNSSTWESYSEITDQASQVISYIPVLDSSDHVSGGLVRLRFTHTGTGISSHHLFVDFVILQSGSTAITSNEHDSMSGREALCTNHPWVCNYFLNTTQTYAGFLNISDQRFLNTSDQRFNYTTSIAGKHPLNDMSWFNTTTASLVSSVNTSYWNTALRTTNVSQYVPINGDVNATKLQVSGNLTVGVAAVIDGFHIERLNSTHYHLWGEG